MVEETSKRMNPLEALKALGRSYIQAGKLDDAIKVFSNVLTDAPDDLESYITLGDLYHQTGDDKLALLMYNQAVRLNPASSALADRIAELDA
jgi:Flp pilus assembly protein TadD